MPSDPTFQQIRAFVAVAEALSYRAAADRLRISQPPLTRHVQSLEKTLGIRLIDRTSRSVRLTEVGAALLPDLRQTLARFESAQQHAREWAAGRAGQARVGYIASLGRDIVPRIVDEFLAAFPSAELLMREMYTLDQVSALRSGDLTCGILRMPAAVPSELILEFLFEDRFVAVVPIESPHGDGPLDIADLKDEDFILFDDTMGPGLNPAILAACADAGVSPKVTGHARTTTMLLSRVASGSGVAIVPSSTAEIPRDDVKYVPLAKNIGAAVLLAWHQDDRSTASRHLRDSIRKLSAERSPEVWR